MLGFSQMLRYPVVNQKYLEVVIIGTATFVIRIWRIGIYLDPVEWENLVIRELSWILNFGTYALSIFKILKHLRLPLVIATALTMNCVECIYSMESM